MVSKTVQYSSAVRASRGCRKSAAPHHEEAQRTPRGNSPPMGVSFLIESCSGAECLHVMPVFLEDVALQFRFGLFQIRLVPVRTVVVDGWLPLAHMRHGGIQLLLHDAIYIHPVIGVLLGHVIIKLLRNQSRL